MWRKSAIWLASILALIGVARAAESSDPRPALKPICVSASETHEEIKSRHLVEPFAALKSAQAQYKAEPLSARLCHSGEEYFYEIAILHRDGHYVHVSMDAVTGKWLESRRPREPSAHETPPHEQPTSKETTTSSSHDPVPHETPVKP